MASLASRSRDREAKLWFVDCFSGPWQSAHQDLEDTSIYIGLKAISEAEAFWNAKGYNIKIGAVFVEKDADAFAKLQAYLNSRRDLAGKEIHPIQGQFGDNVSKIERLIKNDPAFIFIDPTGWKGAAMGFIAPLAKRPLRDVMVNVMFEHVNRFKDSEHEYVQEQLNAFFDSPYAPGMEEEELMKFYRSRLKEQCDLQYTADLIVQDRYADKTKFRLVLGSRSDVALGLFRDVEKKVLGEEAPLIRQEIKDKKEFENSGQFGLFAKPIPPPINSYSKVRSEADWHLGTFMAEILREKGALPYEKLRGLLFERFHICETELRQMLWARGKSGQLKISGIGPRERSLKEHHVLALHEKDPELHEQLRSPEVAEALAELAEL